MARLYALAQVSAFGKGRSNQAARQREWLRTRNFLCNGIDVKPGCDAAYAERNEELAVANLFTHPEIALPELRRIDPEAGPLFEAIYIYAKSPRLSGIDRQRVIALLQPYRNTPGGWGEPGDAVKGDAAFAEFVGVRSAGMPGTPGMLHERYGRVFPCAAAVRKPKLVEATAPRFGSNMDNFVIRSDCEDTLPPLPKFSAMVKKRGEGMTDCGGGSIRFAYYGAFANATLAARLATGSQLRKRPVKPFPPRRKVTNADISAALDELSAYYVRYGRATHAQARPLARQMIYNMLEQAWQC